jgi:Signal peptide peptidase
MGQPALLYLVPCTLGLLSFVSYADGTLRELWRGPPSLEEGAIAAKWGDRGSSRGDAPGDRSTLLYNL